MTPSGWHDDARQRDGGHDEMQARHYWDIQRMIGKPIKLGRSSDKSRDFVTAGVEIEFPFTAARQHGTGPLLGFADVAVWFREIQPESDIVWRKERSITSPFEPRWWYWFFELKPKIASVGALIRQCKATYHTARAAGLSNFDVFPVVYRDDPKADLLAKLRPGTIHLDREIPEK